MVVPPVIPNRVDCAIIKLHSRRVTYLEFHPNKDNILISGDKVSLALKLCIFLQTACFWFLPMFSHCLICDISQKGQIAIWDFEKVYEKTVFSSIHTCIVNSIRYLILSLFDFLFLSRHYTRFHVMVLQVSSCKLWYDILFRIWRHVKLHWSRDRDANKSSWSKSGWMECKWFGICGL